MINQYSSYIHEETGLIVLVEILKQEKTIKNHFGQNRTIIVDSELFTLAGQRCVPCEENHHDDFPESIFVYTKNGEIKLKLLSENIKIT